ncbi:MAG: lysophospholipid acyltransferase family protein [Beijerinckiaceae bacterium]|nr:lysophospholipid acyltransferase family protein [Beijerinckiaceae bacterium]
MLKAIWRSSWLQHFLGNLLAQYLIFVRRTTAFVVDRPEIYDRVDQNWPVIVTIWHGQHLMMPYSRREKDRISVLISSHGDGELNAIAAEKLGIGLIRGSGAQRPDQIMKRGGARALREMLKALRDGVTVAVTADVPKVSRVASSGIVTLAQISGRPIVPIAIVTKRRIDFKSWDRASIGLPFFNRGVIALGDWVEVPADANAALQEAKRREIEAALDAVHARAYALLGSSDPGAGRPSVEAARRARESAIENEDHRRAALRPDGAAGGGGAAG